MRRRRTLKALTNSSPGLALKPWVQKCPPEIFGNPDMSGLRQVSDSTAMQPRQVGVATTSKSILNPRVAAERGNPGLELANAFSVRRLGRRRQNRFLQKRLGRTSGTIPDFVRSFPSFCLSRVRRPVCPNSGSFASTGLRSLPLGSRKPRL